MGNNNKKIYRSNIKTSFFLFFVVKIIILTGNAVLFIPRLLIFCVKKTIQALVGFIQALIQLIISLVVGFFKKLVFFIISLKRLFFLVKYAIISLVGVALSASLFYGYISLSNPKNINDFALPSAILIYDRNNILLYSKYTDNYRIPIKLDKVPQILIDATLSAEDKNFFSHHGFDLVAITRAFIHNLGNPRLEGGSTISQQLAKNLFLVSNKRTIWRKIKEALITVKIESSLNKRQILELYFNTTPYGGVSVGVEAAALNYFGKNTKDLTPKESIFLASLPVGPTMLIQDKTNNFINQRMNYVARQMVKNGKISEKEREKIMAEKLQVIPQVVYKRAPHAVDYILGKLQANYGKEIEQGKGLIVRTSIDLKLQNYIQQKMLEQITLYQKNHITNAAVLVVRPHTGEILSLVGSVNYYDNNYGQFNTVTSPRQLGSALKIITYSYALEHGYEPDSYITDGPVYFKEYPDYYPTNYDKKFHGELTIRQAFANSYNIPALKVAYQLGIKNIADLARQMGIVEFEFSDKQAPLSLVLGGVDVSLEHLTQTYAIVANNGKYIDLNPFLEISDYQGHILFSRPKKIPEKIILSEKTARNIYEILSDKKARMPMFGRSPQFDFGEETVAIKTGTSNDNRDNTAFAFSPDFVIGAWMGNNDNSPMDNIASGYIGSSSLMHDVAQKIIDDKNNLMILGKTNSQKKGGDL